MSTHPRSSAPTRLLLLTCVALASICALVAHPASAQEVSDADELEPTLRTPDITDRPVSTDTRRPTVVDRAGDFVRQVTGFELGASGDARPGWPTGPRGGLDTPVFVGPDLGGGSHLVWTYDGVGEPTLSIDVTAGLPPYDLMVEMQQMGSATTFAGDDRGCDGTGPGAPDPSAELDRIDAVTRGIFLGSEPDLLEPDVGP